MPDKELLARWLEDELGGAELEQVDAWVVEHPEWCEWRDETRAWKEMLRQALPAQQEPPAVEFFDARVGRAVREEVPAGLAAELRAAGGQRRSWWGGWWMPAAAAAGMVLCFWAGMKVAPGGRGGMADAVPVIYTPEQGVEARVFQSDGAGAMVIVLDGVEAIPDSFEIPDRAALEREESPQRLVRSGGDRGEDEVE